MSFFTHRKTQLVAPEQALPGRSEPNFRLPERHRVLDAPLVTDTAPEGYEVIEAVTFDPRPALELLQGEWPDAVVAVTRPEGLA